MRESLCLPHWSLWFDCVLLLWFYVFTVLFLWFRFVYESCCHNSTVPYFGELSLFKCTFYIYLYRLFLSKTFRWYWSVSTDTVIFYQSCLSLVYVKYLSIQSDDMYLCSLSFGSCKHDSCLHSKEPADFVWILEGEVGFLWLAGVVYQRPEDRNTVTYVSAGDGLCMFFSHCPVRT